MGNCDIGASVQRVLASQLNVQLCSVQRKPSYVELGGVESSEVGVPLMSSANC